MQFAESNVQFDCCGYYNSTSPLFVTDATCNTPLDAAEKQGCVGPFSNYVNQTLDMIFTGIFGIVGTYFRISFDASLCVEYYALTNTL